ncbi:hypothetical protein ACFQI3_10200 [Hansschlegelia quercus]|uniref:Uncharacterized protein n=1 Tax=Hansschlegelia quercus TaxID=2528245 RepID=A0A4Q9GMQ6_9HYPH|nr:hypothetical protein [Hansschlegelia quercus]TBN54435.1 hypothetical protein EYR15_06275 [Hansschlegelia quercus]
MSDRTYDDLLSITFAAAILAMTALTIYLLNGRWRAGQYDLNVGERWSFKNAGIWWALDASLWTMIALAIIALRGGAIGLVPAILCGLRLMRVARNRG